MSKLLEHKKEDGTLTGWLENEHCYISNAPQGSEKWHKLRICAITGSTCSDYLGYSPFSSKDPKEAALRCVGLVKKEFTPEQLVRMKIGNEGEPIVRDYYSKHIGKQIDEVGIAIWKKDPRFRASLDGVYTNDDGDLCGVEIKIPRKVYNKLIVYKNTNPLPPGHSHIWESHYNQMIQCIEIVGLKYIDYVVAGCDDGKMYVERIYPNSRYFNNVIYTPGVIFLDTYVKPLMELHKIERLDFE